MLFYGSSSHLYSTWKGKSMSPCVELTREMLNSPVCVNAPDRDLTFSAARTLADGKALEVNPDAMLLAWFDKKSGEFSPRVE